MNQMMRPGDRVLLQHTGSTGVPMSLHLTWATVVEIAGPKLVVRSDREPDPRTVDLDDVRSWSRGTDPRG
jgi:hypothetical protein